MSHETPHRTLRSVPHLAPQRLDDTRAPESPFLSCVWETYTIGTMVSLSKKFPPHAALLGGLLVLFVIAPIIPAHRAGFLAELLFDGVLLAGVYSVGRSRHRRWFVVLTVLTLGARWGQELLGSGTLGVGALGITAVWLSYAIVIITTHLFQRREVTLDTIFAAVVAYLLVAALFAHVFEIMELQRPGSFLGAPSAVPGTFTYFSLVCLTTMGYGDIVPLSSLARPITALEGVFGQMYLAVMIARLVGLNIATALGADYSAASEDTSV